MTLLSEDLQKQSHLRDKFLSYIGIGHCFTAACYILNIHPREATLALEQDIGLRQQAIEALQTAFDDRINTITELKKKRDIKGAEIVRDEMKRMATELITWEYFTNPHELREDATKLIQASYLYSNIKDLATACGFIDGDLVIFVTEREWLMPYLEKYSDNANKA